jgi:putative ABC transport system permease protein
MLTNYFKFAWRNILKDRQFTILNLIGLSAGLACSLLIYLWISDELQVDKFHEKGDRLYQVMVKAPDAAGATVMPQTPALLAATLAAEMPEVEYAAATQNSFSGKHTLSVGDRHFKAVGIYAGKDYFNMFSYPLIQGDKSQVGRGCIRHRRYIHRSHHGSDNKFSVDKSRYREPGKGSENRMTKARNYFLHSA